MLVWSAVLNGIVAVPIMAMMMVIVSSRAIMGVAVIALFWSTLAG